MKKLVTAFLLVISLTVMSQNSPSVIKEYSQVFPTYPFADPNPVPLLTALYPYFRFDGFTDTPIRKEWKVVELENDYIRVIILPEIGGKIWSATEKSTGRQFIYHNNAVKFRDVAMRGPWTSGGIEANYGIIGHTPNCSTPVDYEVMTNSDGSVSCIVGTLDLLTRSIWRLEVNLPKDKAFFTTNSFWYNGTALEQPYYHWMNAGLPVKGNLEFLYPGTRHIGHDGEYDDWPVNKFNGKNINFYEENDFGGYKSYHVFGGYAHFFGTYYHDYDFGMIRFGMRDEKAGKKLWIWGLSRQGMIWEDLLTDTDGQYFELQSGRMFNQNAEKSVYTPFKHMSFAPYTTDVWTEYWYPILDTEGAVEANEYGALNVKYEDGWLKIYFSPVQAIDDVLEISAGENKIYRKKLQLKTLESFRDSLRTAVPGDNWRAVLGNQKLVFSFNKKETEMSRPVAAPEDFDWKSVHGLYMLAKSEMAQKLYPKAEANLKAALEADLNYHPALVLMSQLMYRNMRYNDALGYAMRALSIDTHDGASNYYYGLINEALGNMTDAKDGFDLASLSAEYRSAAHTALARISLKEKNPGRAVHYAQKALDYNRLNIPALQYMAIAYRLDNKQDKAESTLNTIAGLDKISHFANFEKYFADPTSENRNKFSSRIRNEMPWETYAELAVFYYGAGCIDEATRLFELSPPSPEAALWLSYLKGRKAFPDDTDLAFAFPFRSETGRILESFLWENTGSWKLKYLLALVYADRNRLDESRELLASCGNDPDFAPFYAMRAAVNKDGDKKQNLADLQYAVSLDGHWRYVKLLAEYYNENAQAPEALSVLENYYRKDPEQYIIGLGYAKTLLLTKQYAASDKVLANLNLIPFEGATESRDIYREVKLMQAVELMQGKKYSRALTFISQARLFPENLGVGSPYTDEIDFRIEDWLAYICYNQTNKKKEAGEALNRITAFAPNPTSTMETNFSPANDLVALWAYDRLSMHERGMEWLDRQGSTNNLAAQWYKAFNNRQQVDFTGVKDGVSLRVLKEILSKELY
jgi:Tfp pilus assembly protein PilF